jgi:hypothetical protein
MGLYVFVKQHIQAQVEALYNLSILYDIYGKFSVNYALVRVAHFLYGDADL